MWLSILTYPCLCSVLQYHIRHSERQLHYHTSKYIDASDGSRRNCDTSPSQRVRNGSALVSLWLSILTCLSLCSILQDHIRHSERQLHYHTSKYTDASGGSKRNCDTSPSRRVRNGSALVSVRSSNLTCLCSYFVIQVILALSGGSLQ